MAPPVRLPQIPTVSGLYRDGTLQSPASNTSLLTPSASLNAKVSLIRTSITNLATTCIVNAANTSLLGGGGVVSSPTTLHLSFTPLRQPLASPKEYSLQFPSFQDGAIHSAAGPSLLRECRTLNGCPTGSAKVTAAHALPSSYIIHAVGPIYNSHSNAAEKLRSCYRTSLELALEKAKETGHDASIAFSCLSTGIYGYPSGEAAEVASGEVRKFLEELEQQTTTQSRLERVVFCIFETKDEKAYQEWLPYVYSTRSHGPKESSRSLTYTFNLAKSFPLHQRI